MERRVSVNAGTIPAVTPDGLPQGWSTSAWPSAQAPEGADARRDPGPGGQGQGPCLYLGPGGERCGRQALAAGFCAAHGSHLPQNAATRPARLLAAAGAIAALLWPYLEFVVREIIRWAHAR